MKAAWRVHFSTGTDLTDNDLARIRELIQEMVTPVAWRYCADVSVAQEYSVPGPRTEVVPDEYGSA